MKIKCCLAFGSHIKNVWGFIKDKSVMNIFLSLLIILNIILILGVLTDSKLEEWACQFEVIKSLKQLYITNKFNFIHIVTSLGALISLLIFQLRNRAMAAQTKSQYEIFNEDKQFSNFLKATKLLTDKDSTTEAKIAAMFSLADVAKAHPDHLDRVIQVLNKELIPLIKAIDDKERPINKYTSILKGKKITKKPLVLKKETELFIYQQNKIVSFGKSKRNKENIKNWQYNGNETEKLVSVALYVIRKIILELKDFDSKFDFSNTIFFDIDHNFDRDKIGQKFIRKNNKRIESAIFLDCKLTNVNFSKTNFHFCKFINCDFERAKFNDANLWGTSFKNCNLNMSNFNKSECEGLELIACKNLTSQALDEMKFENLNKVKAFEFTSDNGGKYNKDKLKYLMIIDQSTNEKCFSGLSLENFLTSSEYSKWKNSDKN